MAVIACTIIEMGFAQGRRPLCLFLAEGSSQYVARGAASARGGSGGMPTPALCNAPRSQPWPPQASRAGTLASPHAPPRIDAYTTCVYVSYLRVCVCHHALSKVLSLGLGSGLGLGLGFYLSRFAAFSLRSMVVVTTGTV